MDDRTLRLELKRIVVTEYETDDSERNHQAFAAAHLQTQARLDRLEKALGISAWELNWEA